MKLTAKARYAIMALSDLSAQGEGDVVPLSDIAKRQSISVTFLEQLFGKLRQSGLIQSHRGINGGYSLSYKPEEITLISIINAVNEDIKLHGCTSEVKKRCTGTQAKCITHNLWDALETHIEGFFSSTTLAHVVSQDFKTLEAAQ